MNRLFVATRKGLFTYERRDGAWRVTDTAFLGDPVPIVLPDARDGSLYACLDLGHYGPKLQVRRDGADDWQELATPAMPDDGGEETVKLLWSLEAGGADQPGRLWCGTIPGALFRSDDAGAAWQRVDALWDAPERQEWFGGGYDQPGIHSICVHPDDPRELTVGLSCGGVWTSRDDGGSWACRADGMRAAYMPEERAFDPVIQDPHRIARCAAGPERMWCQHHNGVFRWDEAEGRWTELTGVEPSAFGFAVAAHPSDPDTAWFVPAVSDEKRVPADGQVVITRTRDGGRSFEVLRRGLPQEHAYDLVFRHALDVAPDGETLAFGSTTGSLWLSDDGGDSWQTLSANLPPVYALRFG